MAVKRGFVLSMDGLLSLVIVFILFGLLLFFVRDDVPGFTDSVSQSLPVFLSSAQRMGYFHTIIAQNNQTLLDEITNHPRSLFCLNITIYDGEAIALSSQGVSCVQGSSLSASSLFVSSAGDVYVVKGLGWKQ